MCGRASLTKIEKELEERFNANFYTENVERYNPLPTYNLAPTQMHPVITNVDPTHLQYFKWGLIPFWSKDAKIGSKMINARKESLLEKPSFKVAVERRRCIVPLDGFYEWKTEADGSRKPYRIQVKDQEIFSVAGLWEQWKSPEGNIVYSFTIITQEANAFVRNIHDRMPAILSREFEREWIQNNYSIEDLLAFIQPYPDELMFAYAVSTRVNNARVNDRSLIDAA